MARPTGYNFLVIGEALQFLLALHAAERRVLDRAFQFLVDHPHFSSGYQERDGNGRLMEILLRSRFAITFWTDHAVKEVRVVRIEEA